MPGLGRLTMAAMGDFKADAADGINLQITANPGTNKVLKRIIK